jgi:pilus assembly protein CpaC
LPLPSTIGNGKIHLEVEPEISNLNAANGVSIQGTVVPGRDTQRVNTTVELETGQTFVIGGLIQHTVATNDRKTPVLGDLPFVGVFFSNKQDSQVEQEVVILVTPYLVDPQSCDQTPKVLPGQETRTADDFELFLEGILEAPRGPRQVCEDGRYVPAFKHSQTIDLFPCAGKGTCGAGCANGAGAYGGGVTAAPNHPSALATVAPPAVAPSAAPQAMPVAATEPAPGTEPAPAVPAAEPVGGDATAKPAPVSPPDLLPAPAPLPPTGGRP